MLKCVYSEHSIGIMLFILTLTIYSYTYVNVVDYEALELHWHPRVLAQLALFNSWQRSDCPVQVPPEAGGRGVPLVGGPVEAGGSVKAPVGGIVDRVGLVLESELTHKQRPVSSS